MVRFKTLWGSCALFIFVFIGCIVIQNWITLNYKIKKVRVFPVSFKHKLENIQFNDADILGKISFINKKLEVKRYNFLNSKTKKLYDYPLTEKTVVFKNEKNYFTKLQNFSCVSSVILPWIEDTSQDTSFQRNLLINKYYTSSCKQPLCQWMPSKDPLDNPFSQDFCDSITPRKLHEPFVDLVKHNGKKIFTLMQIYRYGLVSNYGEPLCKGLHFKANDCLSKPSNIPFFMYFVPEIEEVFVISAFWGEGYFHRLIEDISRLSLFLEFLIEHPHIKIHCAENRSLKLAEFLGILGLHSSRIVTGWIKAKIIYVPKVPDCGHASPLEIQFLSMHFHNFYNSYLAVNQNEKANTLLLISRNKNRIFKQHKLIEKNLKQLADRFNLNFKVFSDDPAPGLMNTIKIFRSARIVVAPHGAGLANLLFSSPGILVVEGLCEKEHVNFCYKHLAYALGMRWHGIASQSDDCEDYINIDADVIACAVTTFLTFHSNISACINNSLSLC